MTLDPKTIGGAEYVCGRCRDHNHSRHADRTSGRCVGGCRCPVNPYAALPEVVDAELVEEATRQFTPELRELIRKTISDALDEVREVRGSLAQGVELAAARLEPIVASVDANARASEREERKAGA